MNVMSTPRHVEIAITNRCNLRCKYCFHFESEGDVCQELPLEDWLCFFDELKSNAVMDVTLQGGEPFHRKDLKQIVAGIAERNMRFGILTNGALITDEIAGFIASTGRCNQVQVSVDGATAGVHDSNRGPGSFEAALAGIRILKKHGITLAVRVTVTRHNLDDLDNIAKLLLDDIGLPGFSTNEAMYMGLCEKNSQELQLDAKEKSRAMRILLSLNRKYGGRLSASAGPLADARHWLKIKRALRNESRAAAPLCGKMKSCGGVLMKIGVRADGVMVPCLLMSHMVLGRINKDRLADVWLNSPELRKLRERRDVSLKGFKACADCEYVEHCAGGCPAVTFAYSGDEYRPDLLHCLKQFLAEGGELPEEELLFL